MDLLIFLAMMVFGISVLTTVGFAMDIADERRRERRRECQRRSFAYGNASMSNPDVTREVVDRAADIVNPLHQANQQAVERLAILRGLIQR